MKTENDLRDAIAEMPTTYLERYVRVYDRDPDDLQRGCGRCALGAMAGVHEKEEGALATLSQMLKAKYDTSTQPERIIEGTFEGWDWGAPSDNPGALIYDCCVEELEARKGAMV